MVDATMLGFGLVVDAARVLFYSDGHLLPSVLIPMILVWWVVFRAVMLAGLSWIDKAQR